MSIGISEYEQQNESNGSSAYLKRLEVLLKVTPKQSGPEDRCEEQEESRRREDRRCLPNESAFEHAAYLKRVEEQTQREKDVNRIQDCGSKIDQCDKTTNGELFLLSNYAFSRASA
jgi:hypothetical protein